MSFGSDHAAELAKLSAAMKATVVSARLSMAFPLRIFVSGGATVPIRRGHRSHRESRLRAYLIAARSTPGRRRCSSPSQISADEGASELSSDGPSSVSTIQILSAGSSSFRKTPSDRLHRLEIDLAFALVDPIA